MDILFIAPSENLGCKSTKSHEAINMFYHNLRGILWHCQERTMIRIEYCHTLNPSRGHKTLLHIERDSYVLLTVYIRYSAVEGWLLVRCLLHLRDKHIERS